jgi:hypothetical protein
MNHEIMNASRLVFPLVGLLFKPSIGFKRSNIYLPTEFGAVFTDKEVQQAVVLQLSQHVHLNIL